MVGTGELIVIMGLALLLFGGKKLPELARSLGQGIREFKKACNEECVEVEVKKPEALSEEIKRRDAETQGEMQESKECKID